DSSEYNYPYGGCGSGDAAISHSMTAISTNEAQPMLLNSDNYIIHQPSVDSIYIELPSRYHVRSGSAASMDQTLLALSSQSAAGSAMGQPRLQPAGAQNNIGPGSS